MKLLESERRIFDEEAAEGWPSFIVERLERVEIHFDEFGIEILSEGRDDFGEFFFGRRFGQFVDGAVFFVGDAEAVQEGAEQFAMGADEPDLEDLRGEGVVGAHREVGGDVLKLFGFGFPFQENGAEFAELGHRTNGGLVERFFVGVEVREKGIRDGFRKACENLVRRMHKEDCEG